MGMDIFGNLPSTERGRYFRANIWTWPSILDLIAETGVLPADLVEAMNYNDGAGCDEEQCARLADALEAKLSAVPENGEFITVEPTSPSAQFALHLKGVFEQMGADTGNDTTFGVPVERVWEFVGFLRESGGFRVF
jgi:hypothetical protein